MNPNPNLIFPDIRGLSLSRPWPWPFVNGPEADQKRIENRSWKPPKGIDWIALHAAKSYDKQGALYIQQKTGVNMDELAHPHSQIFAVARLKGYFIHPHHAEVAGLAREAAEGLASARQRELWAFGPYCWLIGDVVPLCRPVACAGSMGLWKVSERPGSVLHDLREVYLETLDQLGQPLSPEATGQLPLPLN